MTGRDVVSGDDALDLGVAGFEPLPELLRAPDRWRALERRLATRPFLHSEGLSTRLGAPQRISEPLLARCREVVAAFDRFYGRAIAAFYEEPALRREFLANPLFDAPLLADRARTALPMSRLDCVLTASGELRVIEINPVGVCTIHLQNARYLARELARAGLGEDAWRVDQLERLRLGAFERFYRAESAAPRASAMVGVLTLPGMHRGSRALWREGFARLGWDTALGYPRDVATTPGGLAVRGRPVDVLWGDWVFHLGYQYERYVRTTWGSRVGDYSAAPAETARVLGDPAVLERLGDGRVVNLTPARSYLALSKHLLSWIHRGDRPVDEAERPRLQSWVARTFSAAERRGGALTRAEAERERGRFVLKPCQYGGAHGVVVGAEAAEDAWRRRLAETWEDAEWVLQEFHAPARTRAGEWLSVGLYNYGGVLGGVTLRTASSLVVSARRSGFLPAVWEEASMRHGDVFERLST